MLLVQFLKTPKLLMLLRLPCSRFTLREFCVDFSNLVYGYVCEVGVLMGVQFFERSGMLVGYVLKLLRLWSRPKALPKAQNLALPAPKNPGMLQIEGPKSAGGSWDNVWSNEPAGQRKHAGVISILAGVCLKSSVLGSFLLPLLRAGCSNCIVLKHPFFVSSRFLPLHTNDATPSTIPHSPMVSSFDLGSYILSSTKVGMAVCLHNGSNGCSTRLARGTKGATLVLSTRLSKLVALCLQYYLKLQCNSSHTFGMCCGLFMQ